VKKINPRCIINGVTMARTRPGKPAPEPISTIDAGVLFKSFFNCNHSRI
jgi:hypothetical protein